MKFSISRASSRPGDGSPPPCNGAVMTGETRLGGGDVQSREWQLEIPSLEALLALTREVGPLIIDEDRIEIYDVHVE